jgi:hypothetical protein
MFEEAFEERRESHLKACTDDGTPVGFCGWIIIERNRGHHGQATEQPRVKKRKKESWQPETLDVDSWIAVSNALRTERERVLNDLDNICRKFVLISFYFISWLYSQQLTEGFPTRPDISWRQARAINGKELVR